MNFSLVAPNYNYPRNTIEDIQCQGSEFVSFVLGSQRKQSLLPQYNVAKVQIHPLPGIPIVEFERFLIFHVMFRPFL